MRIYIRGFMLEFPSLVYQPYTDVSTILCSSAKNLSIKLTTPEITTDRNTSISTMQPQAELGWEANTETNAEASWDSEPSSEWNFEDYFPTYDWDGNILTGHHLVAEEEEYKVTWDSGWLPASPPPKREKGDCRATQLFPDWRLLHPGEPVSLDIEFQNFKGKTDLKWRERLGRVAISNSIGEAVLDVYAAYPKHPDVKKNVPPREYGVEWHDLRFENGAVPAHKVERWVKQILNGRTVIVHGGKHDLTAFQIEKDVFANSKVVDTQNLYRDLQNDGTPSLQTAAYQILGESIQELEHSPVEDARATMKLYLLKHPYDRDATKSDRSSHGRGNRGGRRGRGNGRNLVGRNQVAAPANSNQGTIPKTVPGMKPWVPGEPRLYTTGGVPLDV